MLKLTIKKTDTFWDLLASDDKDKILKFIQSSDLINGEKGFQFKDMMYLLWDWEFYKQLTIILWNWRIFNNQVWKFGFYHKIDLIISEFVQKEENFLWVVGPFFNSSLVTIESDSNLRHLDYFPLINSWIHPIGDM